MDTARHSRSRGLRRKSDICMQVDCDGIKAQDPLLGGEVPAQAVSVLLHCE